MCELTRCALCVCVQSERLLKLQLEELREFLQEQLAVSFFLPDDVVVEQLQVAMSELRSKKLDQPPPGGDVFHYMSRVPVACLVTPSLANVGGFGRAHRTWFRRP